MPERLPKTAVIAWRSNSQQKNTRHIGERTARGDKHAYVLLGNSRFVESSTTTASVAVNVLGGAFRETPPPPRLLTTPTSCQTFPIPITKKEELSQ